MKISAERLAWVTLLGAFVGFIGVCAGFMLFGRYVLFEWTINLQTEMIVSRGTAGVLRANDVGERNVRDLYPLEAGDQVSVDELAQSTISFNDPFDESIVVGTLTMHGGSEVQIQTMTRPRFFGDSAYRVNLTGLQGTVDLIVAEGLDRGMQFDVHGPHGEVRVEQPGRYRIESTVNVLRVFADSGQALLVGQDRSAQIVNEGQHGLLSTEESAVQQSTTVNLVTNNMLHPAPGNGIPPSWGCYSERAQGVEQATPLGNYQATSFQGRDTIHIRRYAQPGASDLRNVETGCENQSFRNIDVRAYESLVIRVRMYLVEHSVPGCGEQATECVLMVHLTYRNLLNDTITRDLHQGFFIWPSDGLGWPEKCGTCPNEHEHVNRGVWYTFESEDLIQGLTATEQELRPVVLESIEFYASGHEYEVYIDEVSIIAEDFDQSLEDGVVSSGG